MQLYLDKRPVNVASNTNSEIGCCYKQTKRFSGKRMADGDRGNPDGNSNPVIMADPAEYNVEAIAKLERESLHERTAAERVSDLITRSLGTITFVVFHIVLFVFWAGINFDLVPGIPAFDPFPFG